MIDRNARRELAELLMHLTSGRMTNFRFEDSLTFRSLDPAIHQICRQGAWGLYSDLKEYRLSGKYRLGSAAKHEVARRILFLQTDLDYQWPIISRWLELFALLTFG